ncbi:MAG: UDP-N-acetylmuramate--L-alanine ligase [Candidatus Omnitrophota bacterium]
MKKRSLRLSEFKRVHMVGIGGIGMSGLARLLADEGIKVSGSDVKDSALLKGLERYGCRTTVGHLGGFGRPDLVVRSFSVRKGNAELIEAARKKIPVIDRSVLLKMVMESKARSVSIAGAHGKTTTTAMIGRVLDRAGLAPTILVGGQAGLPGGNYKRGRGDIIVAETDESDGHIANFCPVYSVITNIEKEHMEYYGNMRNLVKAYGSFIRNTKPEGLIVYSIHDRYLPSLVRGCRARRVSFGFNKKAHAVAQSVKIAGFGSEFTCVLGGKAAGRFILNVPGRHNVLNALAAIAVCGELGVSHSEMARHLASFRGVRRRFDIRSEANGILIVEDYAHHPTEIKNVIGIAKGLKRNRIIAVFQPHRYSRTRHLRREFETSFNGADEVVLTDVYAAHESKAMGCGVDGILEGVRRNVHGTVQNMEKANIPEYLGRAAAKGDIILILGAGDINQIVRDVVRRVKASGARGGY